MIITTTEVREIFARHDHEEDAVWELFQWMDEIDAEYEREQRITFQDE